MPANELTKFDRELTLCHKTQYGDTVSLLAGRASIRVQWGVVDGHGDLMVTMYEYLDFRHYPELRVMFDPQTGWNYREVTDFIRGMDQDFQPTADFATLRPVSVATV